FKAMGELMTQNFGYIAEVPFTIVRPSAVYGHTDCNRRVTEIFVVNALQGKSLRLENEGKTMLDFTHVSDTARGIILATTEEAGKGQTFNITAGNSRSLKDLADILASIVPDVEVELVTCQDRFRPARGTLDITKARQLLGYEPRFSLEDGIRDYVQNIVDNDLIPDIKPEIRATLSRRT
ncbi:MAG: NAD-dependent epimerase/dehydratase family protein, partial [Candidatus Nanoarchaeia archaeon]